MTDKHTESRSTNKGAELTRAEKLQLVRLYEEAQERKKRAGYRNWYPEEGPYSYDKYPRHKMHFDAGRTFRERVFMAGNRIGKTIAGAYEVALHATGEYPDWWAGREFNHAVNIWAAGDSNQTTRDIIQKELLGPPGEIGTGMIPADAIVDYRSKPGIPNGIETVRVKHVSGNISTIGFKSYEQGRKSFQGTAMEVIWLDEECPQEVYKECRIRTGVSKESPKGGIMITTFTPLEGITPFIRDARKNSVKPDYTSDVPVFRQPGDPSSILIQAGVDHAPHVSQEYIDDVLSKYPPNEQKARREGIPSQGKGAVYPIDKDDFVIEPIKKQPWWRKAYALDVGWNKTAAVFGAYDPDADIVYIYAEYYRGRAEPAVHAEAIRLRYPPNTELRGVVDPHAGDSNAQSGKSLMQVYRKEHGLKMIPAENAVEPGIHKVWSMLTTGRLKIFSTCVNLLEEMESYRRDEDGKIVKENDHLCDALRYFVMTGLKVAKTDSVTQDATVVGAVDYGV